MVQLCTVSVPRLVIDPMAPPNTMLPVPAKRVRLKSPSIVLEKVIVPAPELVEIEVLPTSDTAVANEAFVFRVNRVPCRATPAPIPPDV